MTGLSLVLAVARAQASTKGLNLAHMPAQKLSVFRHGNSSASSQDALYGRGTQGGGLCDPMNAPSTAVEQLHQLLSQIITGLYVARIDHWRNLAHHVRFRSGTTRQPSG